MPDAPFAAERSIMLPRAPMPFWHIVKVVCSSVYQIQILCDKGGEAVIDEFAPLSLVDFFL